MKTVLLLMTQVLFLSTFCGAQAQQALEKPIVLRTTAFEPQTIHIQVDKLPAPAPDQSATVNSKSAAAPPDAMLHAPAGFTVNVYAQGLPRARWLAVTPDGDILCAASQKNTIYLLRDTNHDGTADQYHVFLDKAHGANAPFGMAFHDSHFYLGNTDAVLRYDYQPGQTTLTSKPVKIADLPAGGYNQHWTRNVRVSPDGQKLFVTIGSKSNAGVEPSPRASVMIMNLDGSDRRVFASGTRNPVGLDFHPQTHEPYVTVNERDGLGNNLVPDYFTRIQQDDFFGWPYVYFKPQNIDPRITADQRQAAMEKITRTVMPDVLLAAHSAALGMTFYPGTQFPPHYRNGAFIAFHGSWNRSPATGYKIVFVPFQDGKPQGHYEDFITGFLLDADDATTWGRPVGITVTPGGELIFTDDMNGRIFRVSYHQP